MPTNDLVSLDGKKNPDGTWEAHVYQDGRPLPDADLGVTGGTEEQVQKLWHRAKARWPDLHLGSGVLECVTRGVEPKNMDGM
jgi:hypothetical protein